MELKIVSFNIRCANDPDGHSILERAPRLHTVIAPIDPDLIAFQEYRVAWEEPIHRYFGAAYDIFNKYRSLSHDVESAPILWKKDRFDCVKTGYFWLSDTPWKESRGWDEKYDCTRMCEYVILKEKTNGQLFTFMNTHYGFGDKCQIDSTQLLYEYAQKISDYPTFITGDFNLTPSYPAYQRLTSYFTDVNAVTANDLRTTYHGYAPEQHPDSHIDFCFVNDKIKPINQKIIDSTVNGKYPSDHFGLEIDLEIPF